LLGGALTFVPTTRSNTPLQPTSGGERSADARRR
jgi:hypothetical protein